MTAQDCASASVNLVDVMDPNAKLRLCRDSLFSTFILHVYELASKWLCCTCSHGASAVFSKNGNGKDGTFALLPR